MRQLRPGHQGLVCEDAWWSLWRFTPTRLGVSSAMDESRVALRTPAAWGPVRLDALTPPAHACSPRVGVCTPPLIGPGQGTPPQSHPPMHAPPRTPCAARECQGAAHAGGLFLCEHVRHRPGRAGPAARRAPIYVS
jgi:hypothetical protein